MISRNPILLSLYLTWFNSAKAPLPSPARNTHTYTQRHTQIMCTPYCLSQFSLHLQEFYTKTERGKQHTGVVRSTDSLTSTELY